MQQSWACLHKVFKNLGSTKPELFPNGNFSLDWFGAIFYFPKILHQNTARNLLPLSSQELGQGHFEIYLRFQGFTAGNLP
jgi:hypothetical protein